MKLNFNNKKTASDKTWMTKEIKQLLAEKHRILNEYKVPQSAVSLKKYKIFSMRSFLMKIETSKKKWKFIKKRIREKNYSPNIQKKMKLIKKTKDNNSICNAFNRVFKRNGYLQMAGRSIEPRKTEQKLRETYKVPDNRDNNKSSVNQQKTSGLEIRKICCWNTSSDYN